MKKLLLSFALLISLEFYGQDIFRYANISPNGIIYLDSALSVGKQYLKFRNDSILKLKKGSFGGCERMIVHLNSEKRVKEILFYYSKDIKAADYISKWERLYNEPVISYRFIERAKYKVYTWADNRTILEFEELFEGKSKMQYRCVLKSKNS